jgi:hypothetical protein
MASQPKSLLSVLQSMKESVLLDRVLIPLFKEWRWEVVDRHHGPDEEGKDLVLWRHDDLGDIELAVVQAKCYKLPRSSAAKGNFTEILTQLTLACENPVPYLDGHTYVPSTVFFVTPFPISTRTLQARVPKARELRYKGLRIIDGPRLAQLLPTHLPAVANELCGTDYNMPRAVTSQLNNSALMRALNVNSSLERPIESFYTDIDLSIGKEISRVLLLGKLQPRRERISLEEDQWKTFVRGPMHICKSLNISLLTEPPGDIERKYREQGQRYAQVTEKLAKVESQLARFPNPSDLWENVDRCTRTTGMAWGGKGPVPELLEHIGHVLESLDEPAKDVKGISKSLREIETEVDGFRNGMLSELTFRFTETVRGIIPLAVERAKLASTPPPAHRPFIQGEAIVEFVEGKRTWLKNTIAAFNAKQPSRSELSRFINQAQKFLENIETLLANEHIRHAVGLTDESHHILDAEGFRLQMSIHKLFDAGENLLVLGAAGTGKTTCMQMYAKIRAETNDTVYLFVPLIQATEDAANRAPGERPLTRLLGGITLFLNRHGCSITPQELTRVLANQQVVLLLDGIDEVVGRAPWIVDAIVELAKDFRKTQVITSSRTGAEYIERIPFMPLTLLPFTDSQRDQFMRHWFRAGAGGGKGHFRKVRQHIAENPGVGEIVRTPLLATVMCVLQEYGIPLPKNEARLYEERLNLLMGHYDRYKGVVRIHTSIQDLMNLAEAIAFDFHSRKTREDYLESCYGVADTLAVDEGNKERLRLGLKELLYPCNILTTMADNGKIGFGHLRFQEFLAAQAVLTDRGVKLMELAEDSWWHGVFHLLSMSVRNVDWLLELLAPCSDRGAIKKTIETIVSARPPRERGRLRAIILSGATKSNTREIVLEPDDLSLDEEDDGDIVEQDFLRDYMGEYGKEME